MEEKKAINLLKQGDLSGLEPLVNQFYLQAVRSSYLIVRDKAQAEDIAQTFFLDLPRKITQFDDNLPLRPWLLKCIVNASINALAGTARFVSLDNELPYDDAAADQFFDAGLPPEEQIITGELRQAVWDSLGKLTPGQRAVIVMRYYLQFDEAEMAQKLNKPKSSIKWWLHSAKERLRILLRPIGTARTIENDSHVELQNHSGESDYE
jgi:RNA polymerase sigma-70 factor (ECF subfamily)